MGQTAKLGDFSLIKDLLRKEVDFSEHECKQITITATKQQFYQLF